jgi:hypothetical protein
MYFCEVTKLNNKMEKVSLITYDYDKNTHRFVFSERLCSYNSIKYSPRTSVGLLNEPYISFPKEFYGMDILLKDTYIECFCDPEKALEIKRLISEKYVPEMIKRIKERRDKYNEVINILEREN